MTQQMLADLTGISRVTITQLENGHVKSIDGENLLDLADALHVSPEYIVRGGDKNVKPFTTDDITDDITEFRHLLDAAAGNQPFVYTETFNRVLDGFLAGNPARREAFAAHMADTVAAQLDDPAVRESVRAIALQTMHERYDAPDINPEYIEKAAEEALETMEDAYGHHLSGASRERVLTALRGSIRHASGADRARPGMQGSRGGEDGQEVTDI